MSELKQIVRIAGVDLDGEKPINHQLTKIAGVGANFSNMVCSLVTVSKTKKAGDLSEQELKRIEEALENPRKFGAPDWMMNRRKDPESGEKRRAPDLDLRPRAGNEDAADTPGDPERQLDMDSRRSKRDLQLAPR